ncbi:MAG: phosphotransferase, partial [Planctomycetota bacterium]
MPHKGPMQLIGAITHMDDNTIHAEPTDHTAPDFPLRIDGKLYTSALVELGAQAAAAHASIHGVGGAHAGLVLA